MALQSITVTMPVHIPSDFVIGMMEGNIKANSKYEVQCHYKEFDGIENVFLIWSERFEAFYLAGITAAAILDKFKL